MRVDIGPEDLRFRPRFVGFVDLWTYFVPGMRLYPPLMALTICTPPRQSAIGRQVWGSTPCEAMSTWWISVFVADLSVLVLGTAVVDVRKNSDPGMGPYPPRVRRGDEVALGFPFFVGRYRSGGAPFRPRFVGAVNVWKGF